MAVAVLVGFAVRWAHPSSGTEVAAKVLFVNFAVLYFRQRATGQRW